ncbi:MAG: hypothetical protein JNN13_17010 [Planctomycetes bacterium]|nr:hypothetical protein [Planctomycetota bacterium]
MDDETWEPIDVMLEEVLRVPAAPAVSAQWRRLLVAALVVVGLGAVAGTFAWREGAATALPVPRPAQDANRVVPKDLAEFRQLLGTATALRVGHREIVGTTRVSPTRQYLDFADWPETIDVTGDALIAWRNELGASAPAAWRGADLCFDVRVLLPDGRVVVCFAALPAVDADVDLAAFGTGNDELPPLLPTPALQAQLRAAHATIARRHRLANGIAQTFAELEELPAERSSVTCPVAAPAALQAGLARFPKLRSLRLRDAAGAGMVRLDGATLRAIAGLPLSALAVDAGALADADLAPLAAMPSLRRLVLHHGGPRLTGSGFASFSQQDLHLGLVACDGVNAAGLATLTKLPRLRGLHLLQPNAATLVFVASRLQDLTDLDTLQVDSPGLTDEHLLGLAAIRLRTLWLGETQVTRHGLAGLGKLPSLELLVLAGTELGTADVPDFAALQRLTDLTIHNSAFTDEGARALVELLPRCRVRLQPATRLLDVRRELDPLLRD